MSRAKPPSTLFVNEFTEATIEAHVGYHHEKPYHKCDYAVCAKRREMIDALNAVPPSTSETIQGAAEELAEIYVDDPICNPPSRDFVNSLAAILSRWFGKGETEQENKNA